MNIHESQENLDPETCKKPIERPSNRIFGKDITSLTIQALPADTQILQSTSEDYTQEIYRMLHNTEDTYTINPDYMVNQPLINAKMRSILIDWLLEVHLKFQLHEETLFLTVNILDRYLEKTRVSQEELQLVGVTAMLIACKYEEIAPPEVSDFVFITENLYTRKQIFGTERRVLKCLGFNVTVPSSLTFYERYSRICKFDQHSYCVGLYLIEISIGDYEFLKFKPSTIAGSAVYLAKKLLCSEVQSCVNQDCKSEISRCANEICRLLQNSDFKHFKSVKSKFRSAKMHNAASVTKR